MLRILLGLTLLLAHACALEGEGGDEVQPDLLAQQREDPALANRVTLDDGALLGALDGSVYRFLGIPYAEPPVGDLRWAPPEKNAPWSGMREALRYQKRCLQTWSDDSRPEGEDCLYLNVWTPVTRPTASMPVMVWLGSGARNDNEAAFLSRDTRPSGADATNGAALAATGVVVVTVDARTGLFGNFAHPALARDGGARGNQGLLDQQQALRWVRDNVGRFGGDPQNVTIFGQGLAARDVCFHLVAPDSAPLFRRAIVQSGTCTSFQQTLAEGQQQALENAKALRCEGPDALACMRATPVKDLLWTAPSGRAGLARSIVDGVLIPDQPRTLVHGGKAAKVALILGSTRDEASATATPYPTSERDMLSMIGGHFGAENIDRIVAEYRPTETFVSAMAAIVRIMSDSALCGTLDLATLMVEAGASAWLYRYDVPRPLEHYARGALSGDEIVPLFRSERTLQSYWTNFAKRGNPNYMTTGEVSWPWLIQWPAFAPAEQPGMVFGDGPAWMHVERGHGAPFHCEFWRTLFDKAFADGRPFPTLP